jgi:hypothetical protein
MISYKLKIRPNEMIEQTKTVIVLNHHNSILIEKPKLKMMMIKKLPKASPTSSTL